VEKSMKEKGLGSNGEATCNKKKKNQINENCWKKRGCGELVCGWIEEKKMETIPTEAGPAMKGRKTSYVGGKNFGSGMAEATM
jgi:hypothetical protein